MKNGEKQNSNEKPPSNIENFAIVLQFLTEETKPNEVRYAVIPDSKHVRRAFS
jgi:hypothetical protein